MRKAFGVREMSKSTRIQRDKKAKKGKVTDPAIARVSLIYGIIVLFFEFAYTASLGFSYVPHMPSGISIDFNGFFLPFTAGVFSLSFDYGPEYYMLKIPFLFSLVFLNSYVTPYIITLIAGEPITAKKKFRVPHILTQQKYMTFLKYYLFVFLVQVFISIGNYTLPSTYIYNVISLLLKWFVGFMLMYTPFLIAIGDYSLFTAFKRSYKLITTDLNFSIKIATIGFVIFSLIETIASILNNFLLAVFVALFVGFPILIVFTEMIVTYVVEREAEEKISRRSTQIEKKK